MRDGEFEKWCQSYVWFFDSILGKESELQPTNLQMY